MNFLPDKRLGFGLMRLPLTDPRDASRADLRQVCEMVDLFLENGFTYFDTAWMYHDFESENIAKKVLVDRHERESFTLATKLHSDFFHSLADRDRILHEQLRKTGAGYFDYYLLHGIEEGRLPKYEEFRCFEWLTEKKEEGLVRHAGFSFHGGADLLDRILTNHPETEFVQLQINYLDWESEWIQSRACYETAVKHGTKVIVMEPVKGGTLARVPDEVKDLFRSHDPSMSVPSWAIRFAASLPGVMAVLSGMSSTEQMRDNISCMKDFRPLDDAERGMCLRAAEIINKRIAIPCTGCSYCTPGCPMHIPIPAYFSIYNEGARERFEGRGWTVNDTNYELLSRNTGRAGDCVACGQCEGVCPQHLPVIDYLKDVAARYE